MMKRLDEIQAAFVAGKLHIVDMVVKKDEGGDDAVPFIAGMLQAALSAIYTTAPSVEAADKMITEFQIEAIEDRDAVTLIEKQVSNGCKYI